MTVDARWQRFWINQERKGGAREDQELAQPLGRLLMLSMIRHAKESGGTGVKTNGVSVGATTAVVEADPPRNPEKMQH